MLSYEVHYILAEIIKTGVAFTMYVTIRSRTRNDSKKLQKYITIAIKGYIIFNYSLYKTTPILLTYYKRINFHIT